MKELTNKDKEIYLTVFHDLLITEIGWIEDKIGDPAMLDYQISLLEKEDPVKFAEKIRGLKKERGEINKEWEIKQEGIELLRSELEVYEKKYEEIIKQEKLAQAKQGTTEELA